MIFRDLNFPVAFRSMHIPSNKSAIYRSVCDILLLHWLDHSIIAAASTQNRGGMWTPQNGPDYPVKPNHTTSRSSPPTFCVKTVGLVLEVKLQYSTATRQGGGERSSSCRKGEEPLLEQGASSHDAEKIKCGYGTCMICREEPYIQTHPLRPHNRRNE